MARPVMTLDQLAVSRRRLATLRLMAAGRPMSTDQVMRRGVLGYVDPKLYPAERSRVRSALRDLYQAGWVERGDAGWRITADGQGALLRIETLRAAA